MTTEPDSPVDEALARDAQRGSLPAFEELVRRYEGRIYRFALNSCRNEWDAREIAQETFVSAYRHLAEFDPKRSLATWLFTIARRKCIDRHRAAKSVTNEPLPVIADENTPAELLARREAAEDLWDTARRVLADAQFHALWLKYAEELSVADIARVLDKTRSHVKVILFRARLVLARELEYESGRGTRARQQPGERLHLMRGKIGKTIASPNL